MGRGRGRPESGGETGGKGETDAGRKGFARVEASWGAEKERGSWSEDKEHGPGPLGGCPSRTSRRPPACARVGLRGVWWWWSVQEEKIEELMDSCLLSDEEMVLYQSQADKAPPDVVAVDFGEVPHVLACCGGPFRSGVLDVSTPCPNTRRRRARRLRRALAEHGRRCALAPWDMIAGGPCALCWPSSLSGGAAS